MHAYSIDSPERSYVIGLLGVLSVGGAWLCHECFSLLNVSHWWIGPPSTMALFWAFHSLFNRHLWRVGFIRRLCRLQIPDIGGDWRGTIHGTYQDGCDSVQADLKIIQTWSHILISMCTPTSSSRSYVAHICAQHPRDIRIYYLYSNKPYADAVETMHAHDGTVALDLSGDARLLTGEYYSGRDRTSQGNLRFTRLS